VQIYMEIATILVFAVLIIGVPGLIGKIQTQPMQKILLALGFYIVITFLGFQLLGDAKMFYPFLIAAAYGTSYRYWKEKKQMKDEAR
jgi:hypothetical protein